ncbi:glutathione S-transferase [Stella humosa]|uniref:glutathione transferase n=1 Tax=Stella humosa TaxID=94 RepID=A0A3N1MDT9_9PROT|nr:glutathione S-transferase family protein [Stella humosa]ROQ01718.1 glutathione S-transferase [Stella humosa]BBK32100.1 glutathione S-transferase [Stella humosa]
MTAPVLFGAIYSVYTRIARLALAEKGVAHRFEPVDIFDPPSVPAEYRGLHPFDRIPALRHGALDLFETAAIARYVDEGFAGPPLQPAAPGARARMAQIVGLLDAYAYRTLVWDVFVERVRKPVRGEPVDEGRIAAALPQAARCCRVLEGFLGGGDWLAGEGLGPTLADLHAAPMFACFRMAPEGASMLAAHAALDRWYRRMAARPSMLATPSPMIEGASHAGA